MVVAAALVLTACGQPHDGKRGAGLNLGKQSAQITLTAGNNPDVKVAGSQGPTTYYRFLVNSSGSVLTGLDATTAADGDLVILRNDSTSGLLIITNADTNSLAANRILTPSTVPLIVTPKGSVMLEYDGTAANWVAAGQGSFSHMITNGDTSRVPTLSSCGSTPSPTIVGNDMSGKVTTAGTATACTITFANTYGTAPSCVFLPEGTATQPVYTTSATAISVTTDIAQTTYNYICMGH